MTDEQKAAGQEVYRLAKELAVATSKALDLGLTVSEPKFIWLNVDNEMGFCSRRVLMNLHIDVAFYEVVPSE